MTISKLKYNVLKMAEKELRDGESLLDAAARLMAFLGDEKPHTPPAASEIKVKFPMPKISPNPVIKAAKPKPVRSFDKVAADLLAAMILIHENGERLTMGAAAELIGKKNGDLFSTGVVKCLIEGGYISQTGKTRNTKWRVLKTPDGDPYVPVIQKCPTKFATGYGIQQKSSYSRSSNVLNVMNSIG